jgi:hypothetical protein
MPGLYASMHRSPMNNKVDTPACLMRLLVLITLFASVAAPAYSASTKRFDIEIVNGAVVGKKSVRVVQGDTVVLRWKSDKPLELHLHGYDVTVTVSPGGSAEMAVHARATGRFPVEVHVAGARGGHTHKPLFHLEVYPE